MYHIYLLFPDYVMYIIIIYLLLYYLIDTNCNPHETYSTKYSNILYELFDATNPCRNRRCGIRFASDSHLARHRGVSFELQLIVKHY